MAKVNLQALVDRVDADLANALVGRPARLREARAAMLRLLMTADVPPLLARMAETNGTRGIRGHLSTLAGELANRSQLPEALCCRYRYGLTSDVACYRHSVVRRDWEHFHWLAKRVDFRPDVEVSRVDYDRLAWHDGLEEAFVEMEAVVDTRALEEMLYAVLEGYLSPRGGHRKGYEVYGTCIGMQREVRHPRPGDGIHVTRYVSVMRSQVHLSADAEYGSVEPNRRSLDAILQATEALYPQYQAVGDFHSHPFDSLSVLEDRRGWTFTGTDEDSNIHYARAMGERGQRIYVALVAAVARSAKDVHSRRYRNRPNIVQLSLGGCRVILAAYRSLGTGQLTEQNTRLRLSGITG